LGLFTRRTNGLSARIQQVNYAGNISIIFIHSWPHFDETRLHGSKHGNPASADAAKPQGINDHFSAGPDGHLSGLLEVSYFERRQFLPCAALCVSLRRRIALIPPSWFAAREIQTRRAS
jgi:hypothetical protein